MKYLKRFNVVKESKDEECKDLLRDIIDIFTDLSEDEKWSVSIQSSRGVSYEMSGLLSGRSDYQYQSINYENFFKIQPQYEFLFGVNAKTFTIDISSRKKLDFIQYSNLISDLKTEILRIEDLGFNLCDMNIVKLEDAPTWFIGSIKLKFMSV